jgi:hypothetical protein
MSVPLTVAPTTSSIFRVGHGIVVVDPSGIELPCKARITYDVRLFVDADGKLHATKLNASCCYHGQMSNFLVAQLDTALTRMTASPPASPLRFGIDSSTNLTWSYTPVIR